MTHKGWIFLLVGSRSRQSTSGRPGANVRRSLPYTGAPPGQRVLAGQLHVPSRGSCWSCPVLTRQGRASTETLRLLGWPAFVVWSRRGHGRRRLRFTTQAGVRIEDDLRILLEWKCQSRRLAVAYRGSTLSSPFFADQALGIPACRGRDRLLGTRAEAACGMCR